VTPAVTTHFAVHSAAPPATAGQAAAEHSAITATPAPAAMSDLTGSVDE